MRWLFTLLLLLFIASSASADVQDIGLKAAIDKGLINVAAKATSQGFNNKGLRLDVKNKTIQTLRIRIEPALIFQPVDTSYQDLVIPGEIVIVLAPNGNASTELQSFCGKSYARAPATGLSFHFKKQGDSALIKVLQFINKYGLFGDAGQHAVWVITNHASLDGVYDPQQPQSSNKLVALLVQLTGRPAPDYFKQYRINTQGGEPAFEMRVLKMFAAFEWDQPEAGDITIGIFNQQGKMIQPVQAEQAFKKGHYKVMVTFEAENAPAGNYFIRVKNKDVVIQEKVVTVD